MSARALPWVSIVLVVSGLGGCDRGRKRPVTVPTSSVHVGSCGNPERDGVLSDSPRLRRADRDLDGDRVAETVVADENLCSPAGNCHWNLFAPPPPSDPGCHRYLGTVAAQVIDRLGQRGEDGFHDLRGWWQLSGGGRVLLQEYRFRHGGYRVVDAMVCRRQDDDRLLCASEERAEP